MARHVSLSILMPLLVFAILTYTCYQYVFNVHQFNPSMGSTNENLAKITVALILYLLSLLSYGSIMLSTSAKLPKNKETHVATLEEDEAQYLFPTYFNKPDVPELKAISLSGPKGQPLYCGHCKSIKPDRAHHCKECHECSLKMDHHCVWINGCVNYGNYKPFFLFVVYVALYCLWVLATMIPLLYHSIKESVGTLTLAFCWKAYKFYLRCIFYVWWNIGQTIIHRTYVPLLTGVEPLGLGIDFHWFFITLLGLLFGGTLTGFTIYHLRYILKNDTSIEYIADRTVYLRVDFDENGNNYEVLPMNPYKLELYNCGKMYNWCQVMGNKPLLWFLPIQPNHDNSHGYHFPYNPVLCKTIYSNALKQREERLKKLNIST